MTLSRRRFNQLILSAVAAATAPTTFAALVEGQDWRAINPPQPGDVPGKIEVLEFFSYGCPHCRAINPIIKSWIPTLADDVTFRRVPVTFGRQTWANLARLYYALEITGDLDRLDQDIFDALHEQHLKLYTKQAIVDWVGTKGVDAKAFADDFDSFAVQTKLGRAEFLANHYMIDAVPTLTVAGRYAVLGRHAQGLPALLSIADQLIVKARSEIKTSSEG